MIDSFKIVDDHHKVLQYWAELRRGLVRPPRLITLDHHTDTSRPFRRYIQKKFGNSDSLSETFIYEKQEEFLRLIDIEKPQTVIDAIEYLSNDEHIVAAIKLGIISSAFVIAHNAMDTDITTYKNHNIMCHSVDEFINESGQLKYNYDGVLEDKFLEKVLFDFDKLLALVDEPHLCDTPYILDIDLDYFNTFHSVSPNESSVIRRLIKGALLVTIATEPEYVKSCAIEPGLTSEYLMAQINKLII